MPIDNDFITRQQFEKRTLSLEDRIRYLENQLYYISCMIDFLQEGYKREHEYSISQQIMEEVL